MGEHPAIEFLNTGPGESIADGEALATWLRGAGFYRNAVSDQDAEDARHLRETLRSYLAGGDVEDLNEWLELLGPPRLSQAGQGPIFDAEGWLTPLLNSILDLLGEQPRERIRQCASPGCELWFLDTSKKGSRRWHSMATCGNANKVRAFRSRSKA